MECTPAACTLCTAPAVVSSGSCVCPVGYYNTSVACDTCSNQFLGCIQCVMGSCTGCNSALFFVNSAGVCVCMNGHIMVSGTCPSCSSLINGCSTCSSPSLCSTCDTASHFTMNSGSCICTSGFYLDGSQNCIGCPTAILGCVTCTTSALCTSCDSTKNFILDPTTNSCTCPASYVLQGGACVDCMTPCVCIGYRWVNAIVGGTCAPFCSDGLAISPTEDCDDGNLVDGDGCSSSCHAEPNYSCLVNQMLSICSYDQPFDLQMTNITKDPL